MGFVKKKIGSLASFAVSNKIFKLLKFAAFGAISIRWLPKLLLPDLGKVLSAEKQLDGSAAAVICCRLHVLL